MGGGGHDDVCGGVSDVRVLTAVVVVMMVFVGGFCKWVKDQLSWYFFVVYIVYIEEYTSSGTTWVYCGALSPTPSLYSVLF